MAKKPVTKKSAAGSAKKAGGIKLRKLVAKSSRPALRQAVEPVVLKKIKSPLSKAEITEFRHMLLDKRRAIIGDMNGIEAEALRTNRQEGTGDLSNMPTHPADVGTDNYEQEFTLGLLESERNLLTEINAALERIDGGTFGVCVGTNQPIGAARLRARPWAKYCIEYARKIEKGLVQIGDESHARPGDDDDEEAAPRTADEAQEDEEEFIEEDTEE